MPAAWRTGCIVRRPIADRRRTAGTQLPSCREKAHAAAWPHWRGIPALRRRMRPSARVRGAGVWPTCGTVASSHRCAVARTHGHTVALSHGCAGVGPKLVKVNVSFNAIAQVDGELLKALTQVGVLLLAAAVVLPPRTWRVALPRGGLHCHVADHVTVAVVLLLVGFVAAIAWLQVKSLDLSHNLLTVMPAQVRRAPLAMRRTPARKSTRPATCGPAFRVSWQSCGRMRQPWAGATQRSTARDACRMRSIGCFVCAAVGSCGCLTNSRTSRRPPTRSSTKPVPTQPSCRTTP